MLYFYERRLPNVMRWTITKKISNTYIFKLYKIILINVQIDSLE